MSTLFALNAIVASKLVKGDTFTVKQLDETFKVCQVLTKNEETVSFLCENTEGKAVHLTMPSLSIVKKIEWANGKDTVDLWRWITE